MSQLKVKEEIFPRNLKLSLYGMNNRYYSEMFCSRHNVFPVFEKALCLAQNMYLFLLAFLQRKNIILNLSVRHSCGDKPFVECGVGSLLKWRVKYLTFVHLFVGKKIIYLGISLFTLY